MKNSLVGIGVLLGALYAGGAYAVEGKWTPEQLLEHDPQWLRDQGLHMPAGADDLARQRAIERQQKELVAECEAQPHRRCEVAAFDGGVRYLRFENLEYPDLRLVYAPPRAVGEYGGEVDNWSWPRHTGDFALLRIYAGPDGQPAPRGAANVPYQPRHFFPLAKQGVAPGDFVMLVGYPGRTFRSYTAAE